MEYGISFTSLRDFDGIYPLFAQLWPNAGPKDYDAMRRTTERIIARPDEFSLVAKSGDDVIGFVSCSVVSSPWHCGTKCCLTAMVVDSNCRGAGVGAALVGAVRSEAKARGCAGLELESSFHRTGAHAFYERAGFTRFAYTFRMDIS